MRFTKSLGPLVLLATTVAADGAAIVAALGTIAADTLDLNSTVASWDGGLLGSLPIVIKSTTLLNDIKSGTKVAEASANLTVAEAISVAGATVTLSSDVNSTLTTILRAKPKFDKLLLSPIILLNLELEKDATDKLSAALVPKVPALLQSTASSLVAKIDASFDQAISAYNPFSGL